MNAVVFVTRRIPEAGMALLRNACEIEAWDSDDVVPRDVLIRGSRGADALLCLLTDRVDGELLEAAPRLKIVSTMSVGYDNVDVAACTRRGIPVGNTPGVLTETTADLAWALLLASARRVVEGADYVRVGRWTTWGPLLMLGPDVHGATLGIIGMGRIGAAVARRARGFGMRILYHDPRPNGEAERETGAIPVPLDELLRESDFVSIHATLDPSNRGMIGAEALARMKPTAVLVNVARGPIVDPRALHDALVNRRIFAAALDVTDPEPMPADHPLLALPNCLVVPHIGSASIATRARMSVLAAENILAGLAGRRLPHCVNPDVYAA